MHDGRYTIAKGRGPLPAAGPRVRVLVVSGDQIGTHRSKTPKSAGVADASRRLLNVGTLHPDGQITPAGRLERFWGPQGEMWRFISTDDPDQALPGFEPGEVYESDRLPALFAERITARRRGAFEKFLGRLGLGSPSDEADLLLCSAMFSRRPCLIFTEAEES